MGPGGLDWTGLQRNSAVDAFDERSRRPLNDDVNGCSNMPCCCCCGEAVMNINPSICQLSTRIVVVLRAYGEYILYNVYEQPPRSLYIRCCRINVVVV